MKRIAQVLGWASLFAVLTVQADLRAGMAAYQRGDHVTARAQFEAGARAGDPEAQYMLGQMHAQGRGTLQNFVEAHKWYNLSAAGGYGEAARARDALERKMTPGQISEAQQQASAFRASAATQVRVASPSRETVRAIQSELNRLGYAVGTPDGLAGSRTRAAILSFERANGLPESGQPSDLLLVRLRQSTRSLPPVTEVRATASASASAATDAALIAELEKVIDEGERRGEAQKSFIRRLRAVLQRNSWPWRHEVFEDDFSDGDYTRGVPWEVASGRFQVGYRGGLSSSVAVTQAAGGDSGGEEIGKVLLKAFINEMAGGAANAGGAAEIFTRQDIAPAFALQVDLGSAGTAAQWEIGPYQGSDRAGGYRLRMQDGALQLVRVTSRGASVVEMSRRAVPAGASLQWTRDAEGQMRVSANGETVIEARDRGVSGRFDGVVIVNRGGDLAVRSIAVQDAR